MTSEVRQAGRQARPHRDYVNPGTAAGHYNNKNTATAKFAIVSLQLHQTMTLEQISSLQNNLR